MRFGVLGLGSMGSRRVRDLLALGHELVGFDLRPDRNQRAVARFGIPAAKSVEHLLQHNLDALVISTPPDQHAACYRTAFDAALPFFGEASILTPRSEWFAQHEKRSGVRGYSSATWRFYAPLVSVAAYIAARPGAISIVHHEYADYLPRWHPWEPYWEFYAGARRQTSAAREMVPFELEWLCWLFGDVASVSAEVLRLGQWRTDIDDAYFLHLTFVRGGHATLRIELHRLASARTATLCGDERSYKIDFERDTLSVREGEGGEWTLQTPPESAQSSSDLEKVYAAEIRAFAAAVAGESAYVKSWTEDRHLSDVLVAAERSAKERRWVDVAAVCNTYDGLSLD